MARSKKLTKTEFLYQQYQKGRSKAEAEATWKMIRASGNWPRRKDAKPKISRREFISGQRKKKRSPAQARTTWKMMKGSKRWLSQYKLNPGKPPYELLYSYGGTVGPFKDYDEAIDQAERRMAGDRSLSWVKIVSYDEPWQEASDWREITMLPGLQIHREDLGIEAPPPRSRAGQYAPVGMYPNPLEFHRGWSKEIIGKNIAEMIRSGYSKAHAVRDSYSLARESWRKRYPKRPFPKHIQYRR
jgi:hypothetical protein